MIYEDEDREIKLEKRPCPCGYVGGCKKFLVPPLITTVEGSVYESAADELVRRWNAHVPLVKAAMRSLNWLSSYPGGGALNCYDEMRDAIAIANGPQEKQPESESDMLRRRVRELEAQVRDLQANINYIGEGDCD